jgi:hypothetical protein
MVMHSGTHQFSAAAARLQRWNDHARHNRRCGCAPADSSRACARGPRQLFRSRRKRDDAPRSQRRLDRSSSAHSPSLEATTARIGCGSFRRAFELCAAWRCCFPAARRPPRQGPPHAMPCQVWERSRRLIKDGLAQRATAGQKFVPRDARSVLAYGAIRSMLDYDFTTDIGAQRYPAFRRSLAPAPYSAAAGGASAHSSGSSSCLQFGKKSAQPRSLTYVAEEKAVYCVAPKADNVVAFRR